MPFLPGGTVLQTSENDLKKTAENVWKWWKRDCYFAAETVKNYLKNRLWLSEFFPPFLSIISAFWEDCCHFRGAMTPVASSPWKASLILRSTRTRTRTLRDLNVININNFLGWLWVGCWKLHFMVILCYVNRWKKTAWHWG